MTRDDILIVEENVHLKHFIYELVRCIDEGVPIANFFACSDRQTSGCDTTLLNAQKHIAEYLAKKVFYGGVSECIFKQGDRIVSKNNPIVTYVIDGIVDVCIEEGVFAYGVAIKMEHDTKTKIYPLSYINNNFVIAESEAL